MALWRSERGRSELKRKDEIKLTTGRERCALEPEWGRSGERMQLAPGPFGLAVGACESNVGVAVRARGG